MMKKYELTIMFFDFINKNIIIDCRTECKVTKLQVCVVGLSIFLSITKQYPDTQQIVSSYGFEKKATK